MPPSRELMTEETAREILNAVKEKRDAQLFQNKSNTPFAVQKLVIPLDVARNENAPYTINVPFKSFWVQAATDVNVTVNVRLLSRDTYSSSFAVSKNDAYSHDDICSEMHLDWAAQSGKSVTIILFTKGEFRSGSQISVTGGGVFLSEGTSFTPAIQTLAAATAAVVFSQDSTRALGVIQNISGASIFVGPSTVTASGATRGEEVPNGGLFEWRNTAALYAISTPGGDIYKRGQN